jgi:hypothetical protein
LKISKSFLWLSIALILLSIVSAVYGYELDTGRYTLDIAGVVVKSDDILALSLINPSANAFDFTSLHYYTIEIDGVKTATKFSHSLDQPLPVIGKLYFGEKKDFELPFDSDDRFSQLLECGKPIKVEFFTFKGKLVARYVNIPRCEIKQPRPHGLIKLNNCTAEYFDGTLKITWELTGIDKDAGKVRLRKTAGRLAPTEGWYDTSICPDVEAGKCMTQITAIVFNDDGNFVTLEEKRKSTKTTLSDSKDNPCFVRANPIQTIIPVDDVKAPGPVAQQTSAPASEIALLDANRDSDIRVCLQGCRAEGECYDDGTRANYLSKEVYCSGKSWLVQKKDGKACSDGFECASEICDSGKCSSEESESNENMITRLLQWIDNLL